MMAALTGTMYRTPSKPERNQQAESRLRAVRGGTEPVEAKDRDALQRADLLGAFVARFDGLADNESSMFMSGWALLLFVARKAMGWKAQFTQVAPLRFHVS